MKRLLLSLLCTALAATAFAQKPRLDARPVPDSTPTPATEEVAVLKTSLGTIVFRFFDQDAPLTTEHIKKLVRSGFYDGKPFYRVVKGHVIQAGDGEGSAGPKVKGEFNKHPFVAGTVGLAHGPDPDSGSTEIFICHAARPHLDGKYTAFGQLISGEEVLEMIANVPVDQHFEEGVAFHKPKQPVLIEKATIERRPIP
jgi:cyclophilin family peptidyl-prolyl cis-trans isomerase